MYGLSRRFENALCGRVSKTFLFCAMEGGTRAVPSSLGMYFFFASSNCDLYFLRNDILIWESYGESQREEQSGRRKNKARKGDVVQSSMMRASCAPLSRLSSPMIKVLLD